MTITSRNKKRDINPCEAVVDTSRAALYDLIGTIFLREFTPELLCDLKQSGFFSYAAGAGIALPEMDGDELELCRALASEYARLFLGPGPHVPPYGSVFRDDDAHSGSLWGSTTGEVRRFMEHHGLTLATTGTIPDHIGVLFEFMGRVIEAGTIATRQGDREGVAAGLELQQRFFLDYIDPWVDRFLIRVKSFEPGPFYRQVVALTLVFLRRERELLGLMGR